MQPRRSLPLTSVLPEQPGCNEDNPDADDDERKAPAEDDMLNNNQVGSVPDARVGQCSGFVVIQRGLWFEAAHVHLPDKGAGGLIGRILHHMLSIAMTTIRIMLGSLGAVLIVVGLVEMRAPNAVWRFRMFFSSWWFLNNPDTLEPSGCALDVIRLAGVFGVLVGAVFALGAVVWQFESPAQRAVDTSYGNGQAATELDRRIRSLATSTGRSLRDRTVVNDATHSLLEDDVRLHCPGLPSASTQISDCRAWSMAEMPLVYVADDYANTGHLQVGDEHASPVCLTVPSSPSKPSTLTLGGCPDMRPDFGPAASTARRTQPGARMPPPPAYSAADASATTSRPNAASRTASSAARSRGHRSQPDTTPHQKSLPTAVKLPASQ
jgi:hypothetical protein